MPNRLLPLLLLSLPAVAGAMGVQHYQAAEHQSYWQAAGSRMGCSLSHEIPLFGVVRFEQQAGERMTLQLEVLRAPIRPVTAHLTSELPPWMHEGEVRDLGSVEFVTRQKVFTIDELTARRVLAELEAGRLPTLRYEDWVDGRDEVSVAISAVNIQQPLGDFLKCSSGILPFSFHYVRSSTLNFAAGSLSLGAAERDRLDELARYLTADPGVRRVTIRSHTDSEGMREANLRVSSKRAEMVRDYLVSKGVSRQLFRLEPYGESQPIASNRTESGRAMNRRVEIELDK